jgi:hypothetical protein
MFRPSCPLGFEACLVGSDAELGRRRSNRYECLNTQSDLESCESSRGSPQYTVTSTESPLRHPFIGGGCIYPVPGAGLGQDCTDMVGVDDVKVSSLHLITISRNLTELHVMIVHCGKMHYRNLFEGLRSRKLYLCAFASHHSRIFLGGSV